MTGGLGHEKVSELAVRISMLLWKKIFIKLRKIRLERVNLKRCPTFRNTTGKHPKRKFFKSGHGAYINKTVTRDYFKGRGRAEREVPIRSQGIHQ
jgi:hypothetical protein